METWQNVTEDATYMIIELVITEQARNTKRECLSIYHCA